MIRDSKLNLVELLAFCAAARERIATWPEWERAQVRAVHDRAAGK